jgi:hypothetical protein
VIRRRESLMDRPAPNRLVTRARVTGIAAELPIRGYGGRHPRAHRSPVMDASDGLPTASFCARRSDVTSGNWCCIGRGASEWSAVPRDDLERVTAPKAARPGRQLRHRRLRAPSGAGRTRRARSRRFRAVTSPLPGLAREAGVAERPSHRFERRVHLRLCRVDLLLSQYSVVMESGHLRGQRQV